MLLRFIILRLLYTMITLFCILALFFFTVRIAVGNYKITHLIIEFTNYLINIFQGNLGNSFYLRRPVNEVFISALSRTLALAIPSFTVSMFIAFSLGISGAVNKNGYLDKSVKIVSVMGISIPPFWLAIVLMFTFTLYWQVLPIYSAVNKITSPTYILPVCTMTFLNFPITMRLVRSAMTDVLGREYIKLARIKGLPERTVVFKHALRNALIIPLTSAGMLFSFIMAGSIIVEKVFMWPGLGQMAIEAMARRDYPVLQAYILFLTFTLLFINFFIDILYAVIDPQIRYQKH